MPGGAARYAGVVSIDRDDDALHWEGDESAAPAPAPVALPEGFVAVGKGADTVAQEPPIAAEASDAPAPAASNSSLIVLGAVGGMYLLYTIGWIVGGLRLAGVAQFLVSPVIYQAALWLAILAAPLWFVTVLVLTRATRSWVRIAWMLAGVLLLVPWPFFMIGAVGQ